MSDKRKRNCLSFKKKLQILKEIESGVKKKDVALNHGIAPSSLSTIVKNWQDVLSKANEMDPRRKRSKTCKYEDIEEAMLDWVKKAREKNKAVTGTVIRETAQEFAKEFGHNEFQASVGWLDRFKSRHGIVSKLLWGEKDERNEVDFLTWQENVLKVILREYEPKNIFNVQETGLFLKCLPSTSSTLENYKCFVGKHGSERVTVLVGANMSGSEKLKLLVVGKVKNPTCFHGLTSFEVDYKYNRDTLMTSKVFEEWVTRLDEKMMAEKRRIALVVDTCQAHPKTLQKDLRNIQLAFFPSKKTSDVQPLDHGVLKKLKLYYLKRIGMITLTTLEEHKSEDSITLRHCLTELDKAWREDVSQSTIEIAFTKAGFKVERKEGDEQDVILGELNRKWEDLQNAGVVVPKIEAVEFVNVPEGAETFDELAYNDNPDSIVIKEEFQDCDGDEEPSLQKPTDVEVFEAFQTIRRAFQFKDGVSEVEFDCLNKCEALYERKTSE